MTATATPRKAIAKGFGLPGGRFYDAAELAMWVAGLNLLLIAFTLLGGVVLGLAPALVAGATVSRARIRGDAQPMLRTFASVWRRELLRANAVLWPFALVSVLLALNLIAFTPGGGPLVVMLWIALGVVALAAVFALTMFTHYDLPLRRYPLTALRYLIHDLPAAALVLVVTVIAVLVTRFAPGLLPVLIVGAWLHAVTAICVSCYTRNDRLVAASDHDE